MLLFFSIMLVILILIFMILLSDLKFKINNLELSNYGFKTNTKYDVKIGLYFLEKVVEVFF